MTAELVRSPALAPCSGGRSRLVVTGKGGVGMTTLADSPERIVGRVR